MHVRMAGLLFAFFIASAAPLAAQQSPPRWIDLAPMPQPQVEAGAAEIGGKIYVMGGWGVDGDHPYGITQVYDIAVNAWSEGPKLPGPPVHHQNVVPSGGKIYMLGGFENAFSKREPIGKAWVFDPSTGQWKALASMPSPRGGAVAGAIDGVIYVAGGERRRPPGSPPGPPGSNATYEPINELIAYDITKDTWSVLPPMRVARDHAVGGAMNGKLYVIGGRDRPVYDLTANEEFDPKAVRWTDRAAMVTGRSGGNGAALDGRFYVFGGEGNKANPLGIYDEAEAWDGETNSWTKFAPMPLPRHSLVTIGYGKRLYLPGGALKAGGSAVSGQTDAFEPR